MTHVHKDLGAYVLGSLDPEGMAAVRGHLAECPTCASEYQEIAGLRDLLDLAVVADAAEDDPLPPAIEERVLDRFARERPAPAPRRRWRPRIVLGLASGLAGAATAVAVLLLALGFHGGPSLRPAKYGLALHGTQTAPGARAKVALVPTESGTIVRLWVYNLPTHDGDVYEVLCAGKRLTASAGTFRVDRRGYAYVILTTAVRRGEYDQIRVVRRARGADGKMYAHDVLDGKLA